MKKIFSKIILLAAACFAFADYNSYDIPDSAEIRRTIVDSWLTPGLDTLRDYKEQFKDNRVGITYQIRLEEDDNEFCVVVAPRSEIDINMINGDSVRTVRAAVYPKGAAGSWILYRSKNKGMPLRIQYFFNQDSDVYLQFRPEGNKTYADLIICGSYAARSVLVGVPFARLYTASFQDVKNWTKKSLPWDKVTVLKNQYTNTLVMAGTIRDNLDSFRFLDDACYDEHGKLKSIFTGKDIVVTDEEGNFVPVEEIKDKHFLSGAGFLKWIIDGIVEPYRGYGTSVQQLTVPTLEFKPVGKNGVMSQEWNLTFTLDWCRNLATEAHAIRSSRNEDFRSAGLDVNYNYFSSEITDGKTVNSTGYIKNTGYSADHLKSMLYVLAVTEPEWFYLGAIRQGSAIKADDLVFNNCIVFFPYFDRNGKFGCFIFEQGEEITMEKFLEKYSGAYVHLERVKATEAFFPYEKK
ncbi:hypothetical protein [Treponema sp.]|uniref:hypothetical protein n=1 Tax=Treponema sp. TaxID=166 RepID=UPI00298DEE73|nr:hypothetical protein [Treponema sp.]MCQ2241104.1 hypothetical protein [Treponema sp.]